MKAEDYKDKEEELLDFFSSKTLINKELSKIMRKDIGRNFYIEEFYIMSSCIEVIYSKENEEYSMLLNKDFLLDNVSSNFKNDLEGFFKLSNIISKSIKKMIIKYYPNQIFDIECINSWVMDRYGIVIYYTNRFNNTEKLRVKKEGVISFFNEEYFNMLKKNIDNF